MCILAQLNVRRACQKRKTPPILALAARRGIQFSLFYPPTATEARRFIGNIAGDKRFKKQREKKTLGERFAQASRRPPSTRAPPPEPFPAGGREESSLKEIMNRSGGEVIFMKMTRAERGAERKRGLSWITDRRRIRGQRSLYALQPGDLMNSCCRRVSRR